MSLLLYWLYTLLHLGLIVWGLTAVYPKTRRFSSLLIIIVAAGTLYDNLILAIGWLVAEGEILRSLSYWRFYSQQTILPLLIPAAFIQAQAAGLRWAQGRRGLTAGWLLALAVIALGSYTRLRGLELQPEVMDGVLRYLAVRSAGPPLASFITVAVVAIVSFFFWRPGGWPWLFWAAVVVFIGEGAVPVPALRMVIGSGVEVVFVWALLATELWLQKRQSPA